MSFLTSSTFLRPALLVLAFSSPAGAAVVYDSISNAAGISGVTNSSAPIATAGNRYTGAAINMAGFTAGDQLSRIEIPMVNTSGAALTNSPSQIRIWLWNTLNTAATGTNPIFADQAGGSSGPNFVLPLGDVNLANNTFLTWTLDVTPLTLSPTNGTTIGITFNYQVDLGAGFQDVTGVNTGVIGGTSAPSAPAAGTNALGAAPNFGYLRSANTDTDFAGNFSAGSGRNIGVNSGLRMRLTTIPEPGTSTIALAGSMALLLRRRMN